MSRYDIEKEKWNENAAAVLDKQRNWEFSETYDIVSVCKKEYFKASL